MPDCGLGAKKAPSRNAILRLHLRTDLNVGTFTRDRGRLAGQESYGVKGLGRGPL